MPSGSTNCNEMSRVENRERNSRGLPRQIRTNSVALPSCGSLLPITGNRKHPPLPRRHSETPTLTLGKTPPPIPERRNNEKPIFINESLRKLEEKETKSIDEIINVSESITFNDQSAWPDDNKNERRRLIDLESSTIDPPASEPSDVFQGLVELPENAERDDLGVRSFDDTGGGARCFDENLCEGSFKSSFEELQKAARDLDKRLHEGIIKSVEIGRCGAYQTKHSRLRCKFDQINESHHDFEKKIKFEIKQAALKNLEKRLEGDDGLVTRSKYSGDMEQARNMLQTSLRKERVVENRLEKLPKATQTNLPPPLSAISPSPVSKPTSVRQDSNVSSDSFSQTSSPSYTSKTMEAPLLPHKYIYNKLPGRALALENPPGSPITKSMSTPASLQTIVRFHSGSNMSLHHRIIRDMRRPSSHYSSRGRIRFRLAQILVNALALLAIAGGFLAYFKTNPDVDVGFVNKTILTTGMTSSFPEIAYSGELKNPAPGICLPVIVNFCLNHKVPYNFTVFPNYIGNFGQRDAQHELESYEAVVDVRCYELAALFLCNVFVPKCGSRGQVVRPCRSLCHEMTRRCGFFLNVFGLKLPDYLACEFFPENTDSDICVGHNEVIEAARRAEMPVCTSGFQCDGTRCIPVDWRCDGYVDCLDETDEIGCRDCASTTTSREPFNDGQNGKKLIINHEDFMEKPTLHCGERRCMSSSHICDGIMDCPWGQDERNCLRLSERNGDTGKGRLQIFDAKNRSFTSACIRNWKSTLPQSICSLLGYLNADSSSLSRKNNNLTLNELKLDTSQSWRLAQQSEGNLLKELHSCTNHDVYPTVDLACSEYACGRRRQYYGNAKSRLRIVGGIEAAPGDWPFLAALLGGPEEVFYCAGVLISDQWVLTASHCVGNHSNLSDWTIQLGITRRHAHSYFGEKLQVKRVVPHPSYNLGVAHDNDVALFQLAKRVNFHEHLRPVCLPKADIELSPGTICTVIGWGKKEDADDSQYEPAVNEVQVPVLERELCNAWLEHKELNVTDGMICAGYPEGKKDACQGDSGGPLLCQDKDDKEQWFVGGIVSWGIKCAHPRLPGVYAYVPKYVPWIRREMAKYEKG